MDRLSVISTDVWAMSCLCTKSGLIGERDASDIPRFPLSEGKLPPLTGDSKGEKEPPRWLRENTPKIVSEWSHAHERLWENVTDMKKDWLFHYAPYKDTPGNQGKPEVTYHGQVQASGIREPVYPSSLWGRPETGQPLIISVVNLVAFRDRTTVGYKNINDKSRRPSFPHKYHHLSVLLDLHAVCIQLSSKCVPLNNLRRICTFLKYKIHIQVAPDRNRWQSSASWRYFQYQ